MLDFLKYAAEVGALLLVVGMLAASHHAPSGRRRK